MQELEKEGGDAGRHQASESSAQDREKAEQLWNSRVAAWFPQGPEDPSIVLIKVTGHTAEYWDTPGGIVASVVSFAKAKATGRPFTFFVSVAACPLTPF